MDENTQNASPAGESMSLDAAVERLGPDAPNERPSETVEQRPDQGQQQTETTTEAAPEALEFLHGNARTRLRDGREVTVAELKKHYGEREDFTRERSTFEAQRRDFEGREAKARQQEQFFTQSIQVASAILQARMPKAPDVSLRETDPLTYYSQKDDYDRWVGEVQQLQAASQAHFQQQQLDQGKRRQAYLQGEEKALIERIPELATEEGKRSFRADAVKHGADYGFSAEDIGNVEDHRLLVVLKDAIAWRKLQAQKPVALEKAKDAPPVQAPGARRSGGERQAQARDDAMARLRQTGRMDDALAVLDSIG